MSVNAIPLVHWKPLKVPTAVILPELLAYGVVNALQNTTGKMMYSPIYSVESDMGTTICLTASC